MASNSITLLFIKSYKVCTDLSFGYEDQNVSLIPPKKLKEACPASGVR
jgi:hypothetical protein